MSDVTETPDPVPASAPAPAPPQPDTASAIASSAVDKGAPWKKGTPSWVILTEGVAGIVIGVLLLLTDLGTNLAIDLLGLLLLATSLVSVYELIRGQVAPGRVALISFRAGVGVTTGVLVLIGSWAVGSTDEVTRALAVVLGVGLLLFGVVGLASSILQRKTDSGLPVASLIVAGGAVVVGLLLTINGVAGYDQVKSTFKLLGVLLIVAGIGLCIYGYTLRQRRATDPTG